MSSVWAIIMTVPAPPRSRVSGVRVTRQYSTRCRLFQIFCCSNIRHVWPSSRFSPQSTSPSLATGARAASDNNNKQSIQQTLPRGPCCHHISAYDGLHNRSSLGGWRRACVLCTLHAEPSAVLLRGEQSCNNENCNDCPLWITSIHCCCPS